MPGLLEQLNETILPQVFDALAGVGVFDTMTVYERTYTKDTGGGVVTAEAVKWEDVPCSFEPMEIKRQFDVSAKLIAVQQYRITCGQVFDGERIALDPTKHRIVVNARGGEPAKRFRIHTLRDISGVHWEVVAERENQET